MSDTNTNNLIGLLDTEKEITNKIKRAVTDSGSAVNYKDASLGLQNLMNIYSLFSGMDYKTIEYQYSGKGYKEFKEDLGALIIQNLKPIQKKFNES